MRKGSAMTSKKILTRLGRSTATEKVAASPSGISSERRGSAMEMERRRSTGAPPLAVPLEGRYWRCDARGALMSSDSRSARSRDMGRAPADQGRAWPPEVGRLATPPSTAAERGRDTAVRLPSARSIPFTAGDSAASSAASTRGNSGRKNRMNVASTSRNTPTKIMPPFLEGPQVSKLLPGLQ